MLGVLLCQETRELSIELVDEGPVQDMAQNEDNIFQADQCNTFKSNVNEAPTTQTSFMANISSTDPVYDEACPSYDYDTLPDVQDHDNYLNNMNESHEEHEMNNVVQPNDIADSNTKYTSNSNIISYEHTNYLDFSKMTNSSSNLYSINE
nr:integrase, catalytic region, zinc finger, CCHC-type, peptidase aspartic, catalytic [Tanacetum cinerariifolium]